MIENPWENIEAEQSDLPLTNARKSLQNKRFETYAVDGNLGREASVIINEIKNSLRMRFGVFYQVRDGVALIRAIVHAKRNREKWKPRIRSSHN